MAKIKKNNSKNLDSIFELDEDAHNLEELDFLFTDDNGELIDEELPIPESVIKIQTDSLVQENIEPIYQEKIKFDLLETHGENVLEHFEVSTNETQHSEKNTLQKSQIKAEVPDLPQHHIESSQQIKKALSISISLLEKTHSMASVSDDPTVIESAGTLISGLQQLTSNLTRIEENRARFEQKVYLEHLKHQQRIEIEQIKGDNKNQQINNQGTMIINNHNEQIRQGPTIEFNPDSFLRSLVDAEKNSKFQEGEIIDV